jgi:hypothetical protein
MIAAASTQNVAPITVVNTGTDCVMGTNMSTRRNALSALLAWPRLIPKRIRTVSAKLLDSDARAEREIIARYAGCSWCDSVERRLNDDIESHHCSRL